MNVCTIFTNIFASVYNFSCHLVSLFYMIVKIVFDTKLSKSTNS